MSDRSQQTPATQNEPSARRSDSSAQEPDHPFLERQIPHLAESIRKTSFWAAIVLPVCYLPLLAVGLGSRLESTAFLLLLGCNLLALYVGHSYRR
ncbi:hypothetical protein [Natrarchaeobaculum aegyptiacum]|uniref:Uncharacterized protein n=1 Tax=Natrarchaeobaculum aegyptiacum TaxID=745377 RepID=A0A2Z2HWJ6_9EURY|nr:hypothetical protein [Natrarchaeobaculum aegyptiacum]ARS91233.1 hypothetical protein B1756_16855 [Natrarchaeobaculum aegyptiacum]